MKPSASDLGVVVARFWFEVLQATWERALTASDALSDTLLEASSGPLYKARRDPPGAASEPVNQETILLRALERFVGVHEPPARPVTPLSTGVSHVLHESHAFLRRRPGGRAPLSDLVAHVAHRTGHEKARVQLMILRHFQCDGERVWK